MKLFSPLALSIIVFAFAELPGTASGLLAQTAGPQATPTLLIEISGGKILGAGESGKPLPATLRNVVDQLLKIHPDVAITFVGLEKLSIDNVTLRLTQRSGSLDLALAALAEASGRKFGVKRFGATDILLAPEQADRATNQSVEVFNLSRLLPRDLQAPDRTPENLRDAYNAVRKQFTDEHPRVKALKEQLESAQSKHPATASRPAAEARKLVERIQETAEVTAAMLESKEVAPRFMYHEETRLLIVAGGPDAIDITRKIIAALAQTPQ